MLSGLRRWMYDETASNRAFSVRKEPQEGGIQSLVQQTKKKERTRFDCRVHQSSIFLQLHSHSARVFPVPRMSLVNFMNEIEMQLLNSIGNVFAQRPPKTLFPW